MKGTKEFEKILQKNSRIDGKYNEEFLKEKLYIKNVKSTSSGITMIALIVIIVVLLILASISISVLNGNNGIINKSQSSKEQHEIASEKETLKLAVSEAYEESAKKSSKDKSVRVDKGILKNVLDDDYADKVENTEETDNGVKTTFTESGRTYTVDTDGNVTEDAGDSGDSGGSTGISASDFPASEYGAIVDNYKPVTNTDVQWQVFYTGKGEVDENGNIKKGCTQFTDDDRIYLIATNYVKTDALPKTAGGKKVNTDDTNSYARDAWFSDIVNGGEYAGSESIKNSKLQKLNQKYYEYLESQNPKSSEYANIKSVAYMMDTSIWGDTTHDAAFIDSNWGDYVIGGPTEELLFASYNKKYGTKWVTKVDNKNGYSFGKYTEDESGNETTSYDYYIHSDSDHLRINSSTYDSTYVINKQLNAYGMWLASPSGLGSHHLTSLDCHGYVGAGWLDDGGGFRPLVCLQAGVKLEKVSEEGGVSHYMLIKK